MLDIDGLRLTQSLAIIEYLHETRPGSGLLPADPVGRARVRALSQAIAGDIHPVCNLGVIGHVMELTKGGDAVRSAWMKKFIGEGLAAFETLLDHPATGRFCHGDQPTMADLCLVPQLYNARRWQADIASLPRLNAIADRVRDDARFPCGLSKTAVKRRCLQVDPPAALDGSRERDLTNHGMIFERVRTYSANSAPHRAIRFRSRKKIPIMM